MSAPRADRHLQLSANQPTTLHSQEATTMTPQVLEVSQKFPTELNIFEYQALTGDSLVDISEKTGINYRTLRRLQTDQSERSLTILLKRYLALAALLRTA